MRILTLDTSSHALVVAWSDQKKTIHKRVTQTIKHSEQLFGILSQVKKRADNFKKLDIVSVGLGPGSFTGLRVGVVVAKTLSYSLSSKLVGISSMHSIALNLKELHKPVCVIQDAKKNQLYYAVYDKYECLVKPCLIHYGDFLSRVSDDFLYIGDGLDRFVGVVEKRVGKRAVIKDKRKWYPRAEGLLDLTTYLARNKEYKDPFELTPEYVYQNTCHIL